MQFMPKIPATSEFSASKVSGFILAGGQSSRMGKDKALVLFAGSSLLDNALKTFSELGIQARVAGARSILSGLADVIPDTFQNVGPMGGIHAALSISVTDWNVFLPVDMPLMPASLLARLIHRAEITNALVAAASLAGRLEPYPVVLHRSTFPLIVQRLENGQTAGHAAWSSISKEFKTFLQAPSVENLVQCGQIFHPVLLPPSYWFQSANTPEDLAYLNRIHGMHFR